MFNMKKIIIIGNYDLEDKDGLKTIAMQTTGLRVDSMLYINDQGSCPDKKLVKNELREELYSDQYDEDSLKISVKEAFNGNDAAKILLEYLKKKWDKDTVIYYYEPHDDFFEYITDKSNEIDCRVHICDYYDIFNGKPSKDIYTIMEENNLNIKNMLKDSYVSLAYFLSALVELMLSR